MRITLLLFFTLASLSSYASVSPTQNHAIQQCAALVSTAGQGAGACTFSGNPIVTSECLDNSFTFYSASNGDCPSGASISFIQTHSFPFETGCEVAPDGFCVPEEPPVDCTPGETGVFSNLDLAATFGHLSNGDAPAGPNGFDTFNVDGCSVELTGCVPDTRVLYRADDGALASSCDATYTNTGNPSDGASVSPTSFNPGPPIDNVDDRQTTTNSNSTPPNTTTSPNGDVTTTTTTTTSTDTTAGQSGNTGGNVTTITNHNTFNNTNITTTTTTTSTSGDITSNRNSVDTNQGGGTTTISFNDNGTINTNSTDDQDNTTTTDTNSTIGSDGGISTETTGGDCVGDGCDGEGEGLEDGGFCDFAPEICGLADFLTSVSPLPEHPDLPEADVSAFELPFDTYQAPSGQCLANPTINVFGDSVEIPFSETVCVFCELFRPIMAILGCLFGIGILLGGGRQ